MTMIPKPLNWGFILPEINIGTPTFNIDLHKKVCNNRCTLIKRNKQMKSLGVKFSDKTDLQIKDIASAVDMPNSKIARAAMQIGLMQLRNAAVKDCDNAKSFIAIEDAKSRH